MFAEMEEATGGRLQFEIHYGGELYNEFDGLMACQDNAIQSTAAAHDAVASLDERWDFLSLPFLFDDGDHMGRFMQTPAWNSVLDSLEQKGLMSFRGNLWRGEGASGDTIGYFFYTGFPPDKLENWAGKKVRVRMTPTQVKMAELLGFQAQEVNMAELPMAMQTGMVEGVLGVCGVGIMNFLRYQDYYDYVLSNRVVIGTHFRGWNTTWYNQLPDDIKDIIDPIAADMVDNFSFDTRDSDDGWAIITSNLDVVTLTSEELAKWRDLLEPLYADYRAKTGFAELFEAAEATRGGEPVKPLKEPIKEWY